MMKAPLRRPRKLAHGKAFSRLAQIRFESGLTKHRIAEAAQVPPSTINDLEQGRLPHNDPRLARIAAAYKVDESVVREQCDATRTLGDKYIRLIASGALLRNRKHKRRGRPPKADTLPKGRRLVVAKKAALTRKAQAQLQTHTYDVARPIPASIKSTLRKMANATNLAVLRESTYVDLRNMPTRELAEMMSDYFVAKGITIPMVLVDNYGGVFDE